VSSPAAAFDVTVWLTEREIDQRYGSGSGRPLRFNGGGASVAEQAVAWVWADHIPAVGLSVVTSYPGGLGVPTLLRGVVAAFTVGSLPGDYAEDSHDVLLVSREDMSSVDIPRLWVAGADLTRVHVADRALSGGTRAVRATWRRWRSSPTTAAPS
jgi:hypothetical protein